MLRKMMLLAIAVGALVAFAAPVTANAAQWYTSMSPSPANDTLIGGFAERDEVHVEGHLSTTQGVAELTCDVTATVTVWNDGGEGTGSLMSVAFLSANPNCHGVFHISEQVSVTCTISAGVAGGGGISTEGANVAVEEAFFLDFFEGCPLGIEEIGVEGTLTGTFNNETSCIEFANSGDLENPEGPVTVVGSLCETTGRLTLH